MAALIMELRQDKADLTNEMRALMDKADGEGRESTKSENIHLDSLQHKLDIVAARLTTEEAKIDRDREMARRAFEPRPGDAGYRSPPGCTGATYREMWPDAFMRNDGFETFGDYLAVIDGGLHHPAIRAAGTEGVPSGGGFFVPEEFAAQMLDASLENEIVRDIDTTRARLRRARWRRSAHDAARGAGS